LINALKYSPPDSPVEVRVKQDGGCAVISVHNDGPPIPPDQLDRLFEPMRRGQRTLDSRSRSVGLGLFIVVSIVQAHQGSVEAVSTSSTGTTFLVRLPVHPQAEVPSNVTYLAPGARPEPSWPAPAPGHA
jgi:phosphoserine phosphatase RsbU/P